MTSSPVPPSDVRPAAVGRIGRWAGMAASVLVVLLPAVPLWPLTTNFFVDWYNHQWAVGYFGEYLRQHGAIPSVFNTEQWLGLAAPVFYGNLGYALLAVPAVLLAAGVVMRLVAVLLFIAQYGLVRLAFRRIGAPPFLAGAVGALVVWATYSLTNLYNRGALTEFLAASLLTCAVALAVLLSRAATEGERRRWAGLAMFCLTLSAGTHPITALFGVPFFVVLVVLLPWLRGGGGVSGLWAMLRHLVGWAVPAILCLGAWVYATARFSDGLHIRQVSVAVALDPAGLDHWLTRFYPIPLDARVVPGVPLRAVSTPYLDAQANVPLLVLFLVLTLSLAVRPARGSLKRQASRLMPPALLFGFFTWISLSQSAYGYLPSAASMIQLPYRAITYQNLSILLGLIVLVSEAASRETRPRFRSAWFRVGVLACVVLAAAGVVVKWSHARATARQDGSPNVLAREADRQGLVRLPRHYYAIRDYAVPGLFPAMTGEERRQVVAARFAVGTGPSFGESLPMALSAESGVWLGTNVQAFPWNRFFLDGRPLPQSCLRSHEGTNVAVLVPVGGRRVLTLRFEPDPVWRVLRVISLATLYCWALYACWVLVDAGRRRLHVRGWLPRFANGTLAAADRQVPQ